MELSLQGKTALVVASSRGLGKAIAKQFILEGANVMLASRNDERLKEAENELKELGQGRVQSVRCDITNPSDISNMAEKTIHAFGGIDILINNAGGPPAGGFEDMKDEDWQRAFELNLLSYIRIIRETLPALKQSGGRIINIASSSIKEPIPGLILSNTFRLGIVGLAKTLSAELAPHGILVNTVAPGRIATERIKELDRAAAERNGLEPEAVAQAQRETIPLRRDGEPEEFAKVVVFLSSGANTYMTGSSFFVDGGKVKSI